jgi:hypothetical protein
MSITEDFATQWLPASATKVVIPQEDRNFSRPNQSLWQSTVPLDVNMANDLNQIKNIQSFLKTKPLGVGFSLEVDGQITPELLLAISSLERKANNKFNTNLSLRISNKINFSEFSKLVKLLKDESQKKTEILPDSNSEVKKFQKFFNLKETGILDQELISLLKNLEQQISKDIDESVSGMIIDSSGKSLNTTIEDVKNALQLIKNNKINQ